MNLIFAGVAFVGGALLLTRQSSPVKPKLDVPGVLLVSSSVFCLVYGFANAATHSWGTPSTWGFLAAGVVLGIAFALWQGRAAHPLLPPRGVLDRNRGGAYLSMFIATAGLAQIGPHTAYATGVLGPIILVAIGLGMVIAPVINTGTFGVAPQDAGVASATVTVGQQLGASIGTALLNTIFTAAITSYIVAHLAAARIIGRHALTGLALAHGYDTAFWWIAGFFAVGAVVGGTLLRRGPLAPLRTPPPAQGGVETAQAETSREQVQ